MPSIMQREFGGYPFLDNSFLPSRLLTAAAMCRWSIAHPPATPPDPDCLAALLDPAEAKRIRGRDFTLDLPCGTLSDEQQLQITQTRTHIATLLPEWKPLIDLPVLFVELLHSQAVSSSNFAWPQHIFLSPKAFATPASLAEQILHETSHQWLYLIEEMFALEAAGPQRRFRLPSGTSDRTASELLGAAHVVVNLRRLWHLLPVDDEHRRTRLTHLQAYGTGCADLIDGAADALTGEGLALAARLTEEIRNP